MSDLYYVADNVPEYDTFYTNAEPHQLVRVKHKLENYDGAKDNMINDRSVSNRLLEHVESVFHVITDVPYGITKSVIHTIFHK